MAKICIGITGENGFLGTHLRNHLKFRYKDFNHIPFERNYFDNQDQLDGFVSKCDIIVHLAGLNRNSSPSKIYSTNLHISHQLANALLLNEFKGQLIFSSSLHENQNTPYGKSKKESHQLFIDAAEKGNFSFVGLVMPNIYGPFCKPNYNSFITTFCHNLVNNKQSQINDNPVSLIFVDSVVDIIVEQFNQKGVQSISVPPFIKTTVREVWELLKTFKKNYFDRGEIPNLNNEFELSLFNTFRATINPKLFFPKNYKTHKDERGYFTELIRESCGGQVSFSVTKPKVSRGDHFHIRKIERFSVINGEAELVLRKVGTSDIVMFKLSGKKPAYVDIPIWYTHRITNIGNEDLITVFWINEHYDEQNADVYIEKV